MKITHSTEDGKLVEHSETTIVENQFGDTGIIRPGAISGTRFTNHQNIIDTTYEDLGGDKKRVVKSVIDGKEGHAGAMVSTYQLADHVSVETTVEAVPYKFEFPTGGYVEVSLQEQVCTTKIIH